MSTDGASQPLPALHSPFASIDEGYMWEAPVWNKGTTEAKCRFCGGVFRFRSCQVNGMTLHANICNECAYKADYKASNASVRRLLVKEYAIYRRISNSQAKAILDACVASRVIRNSLI